MLTGSGGAEEDSRISGLPLEGPVGVGSFVTVLLRLHHRTQEEDVGFRLIGGVKPVSGGSDFARSWCFRSGDVVRGGVCSEKSGGESSSSSSSETGDMGRGGKRLADSCKAACRQSDRASFNGEPSSWVI